MENDKTVSPMVYGNALDLQLSVIKGFQVEENNRKINIQTLTQNRQFIKLCHFSWLRAISILKNTVKN